MQTTDGVICIHHEADWSSTATVSWGRNDRREVMVEAQILWDENYSRGDIELPTYVAVRAVRLATRGRAMWEHGQVLSRPVPGRRLAPIGDPVEPHDPTDAWLFAYELRTLDSSAHLRHGGRPVPLGWVENVAIAMHGNGSSFVLVDIGAPHREPCTCGKAFHDVGCPQSNTFPTIGRLAINLARVDAFCETLQRARTSDERFFVPESPSS